MTRASFENHSSHEPTHPAMATPGPSGPEAGAIAMGKAGLLRLRPALVGEKRDSQ